MRRRIVLAISLVLAMTRASSAAIELVANGDFSAGLDGWTVFDQAGGSGMWSPSTVGFPTPTISFPTSAVGAATGGYAVTHQEGAGAHALEQSFTIPGVASSVILSFDMFVNDWSGMAPVVNSAGLDYTSLPNQHGRVDLLGAGSAPLDTSLSAVLANFFTGNDLTGADPNPFTHYSFDITSLVSAGGTYELRFAEVDNQLFFNMGVDNVSILFTPREDGGLPEPATLVVWTALSGIAGVGVFRARRRRT